MWFKRLNKDRRLDDCECAIRDLCNSFDEWHQEICALRLRITELEKNQIITPGFKLDNPFGNKFTFTFKNPDGTPNGGMCNNSESLPGLVEWVRDMQGTELVIKDESIYIKVTKSSL
jgi:hypothetical protein